MFVQSRKTSAAEPSGGMKTPDLGHFTRSVIQSLENIKFTPSQGVCTPSPTIMVHHHHHVYGATTQGQVQEDQISNAYLAGLAAGRADAERKLKAGQSLIQAGMYESPNAGLKRDIGDVGGVGGVGERCGDGIGVKGDEGRVGAEGHGVEDDARSLDGHGPSENTTRMPAVQTVKCVKTSKNPRSTGAMALGDRNAAINDNRCRAQARSKSASPCKQAQNRTNVDCSQASQMAFALLSAHGIHGVEMKERIPTEVFDLASLLVTLEIPEDLITTPAGEFNGQGRVRKRLNARQRRTLRRSQERAWKELEALKGELSSAGNAQYVHRTYSPTCLEYGVNPAALAEYNGYAVAPHGLVQMHSPGIAPYVQPVTYPVMGHGHPQMANFVPVHPHPHAHGQTHGRHPGHGQQRTLSRFADR